jgi:integrase
MSVRKRVWKTTKGEPREAWVVAYTDSQGKPRIRTFNKKSEAKTWETSMRVEVRDGTHTAFSQSSTVRDAAEKWLATAGGAALERATTDEYKRHIDFHINPSLGRVN